MDFDPPEDTQVLPDHSQSDTAASWQHTLDGLLKYDFGEVAANLRIVSNPSQLIDSRNGDGSVFGFVAQMDSIGSIPQKTVEHIMCISNILESSDTVHDILADSSVRVKVAKNKETILECHEPVDRRQSSRNNFSLCLMTARQLHELDTDMMREGFDGPTTREVCKDLPASGWTNMVNGRIYITIHQVEYKDASGADAKLFAVVAWVVCHRNFDFIGKIKRLYGNSDRFRKRGIQTKARVESKDVGPMESAYGMWSGIIHHQWNLLRIQQLVRREQGRSETNPFDRILCDYNPESMASTCNAFAVFKAIVGLCPPDSSNIWVEGMDPIEHRDMNIMQYVQRFRAWRSQFIKCKKKQFMEIEQNKKRKRGEADEIDESEIVGDNDMYNDSGVAVPNVELISIAGRLDGEAPFVESCLTGCVDQFDTELGRARLPYCPGWLYDYNQSENSIRDCIPSGLACMHFDASCLAQHMANIIEHHDVVDFKNRLGSFPPKVLAILEERTFTGEDVDAMIDEDEANARLSVQERRDLYDRAQNPLMGYLHDRSNEAEYISFLARLLRQPGDSNMIRQYLAYVNRAVHKTDMDITSGKMHGQVFDSTFKFLKAVNDDLPGKLRNTLEAYRSSNDKLTGSDFEVAHRIFDKVLTHTNATNMKLCPQNMFLLVNLYLSELLWRCGTLGNWLWIGMTVQVSDAAGLTSTVVAKCEVTNYKKVGTCGYDFTRTMYTNLRNMYKYVVPQHIVKALDKTNGQSPVSNMKVTPAAVGEGMITIIGNDVRNVPPDTLGTMQVYPEGFAEKVEVIDMVLKTVPRDDNINFKFDSTSDPHKNGIRARMIYQSIPGFSNTILTFAENRQSNPDYVRRKEDFGRVVTTVASSGPCEREARRESANQKVSPSVKFTNKQQQTLGPFFAMVPMVAMRAALIQKLGVIQWDIGVPVNTVLQFFYQHVASALACMISPLRLEHGVRYFGSSVAMAGVSKTLWLRTFAKCSDPAMQTVDDIVKAVVQEQHTDALHHSLIPSVMMRYLTSILDYQTLAVMQRLLRYLQVPCVGTRSVMAFIHGIEVPSQADREAMKAFIEENIQSECFGRQTESGSRNEVCSETENMSYYVIADKDGQHNPMRTSYTLGMANNKDMAEFKRDRLREKCIATLSPDLTKFAKFCADCPAVAINAALNQMFKYEYKLGGRVGLFNKPKLMFRTLFGDHQRFGGMPDYESNCCMLKVVTSQETDIALGVNLPSALLMQSLMGNVAGCDWELQVTMAKNLTELFVVENVPYAMMPTDNLMMDSYMSSDVVSEVKSTVPRNMRPLVLPRDTQDVLAAATVNADIAGDGPHGLIEDVAHMHSICSIAKEVHYSKVNKMNLNFWELEVWWGNPGDVTPLMRYTPNVDIDDETFAAVPGKSAYVQVDDNNQLCLHVSGSDAGKAGCTFQAEDARHTHAQRQLFEIGWGPAPKWQRSDVLFEHSGDLYTLVPHDYAERTIEELMQYGFKRDMSCLFTCER